MKIENVNNQFGFSDVLRQEVSIPHLPKQEGTAKVNNRAAFRKLQSESIRLETVQQKMPDHVDFTIRNSTKYPVKIEISHLNSKESESVVLGAFETKQLHVPVVAGDRPINKFFATSAFVNGSGDQAKPITVKEGKDCCDLVVKVEQVWGPGVSFWPQFSFPHGPILEVLD